MRQWLLSRILTVGDVGRWHARARYPRADCFVELPLYSADTPLAPDPAGADTPEPGRPARADRPLMETADDRL